MRFSWTVDGRRGEDAVQRVYIQKRASSNLNIPNSACLVLYPSTSTPFQYASVLSNQPQNQRVDRRCFQRTSVSMAVHGGARCDGSFGSARPGAACKWLTSAAADGGGGYRLESNRPVNGRLADDWLHVT